jgi:PAS domain-containing protein
MTTPYSHVQAVKPRIPAVELDNPRCGRLIVDHHGIIVGCDAGCEDLFGGSAAELIGCAISVLVPKLALTTVDHWLTPNIAFLSHCEIPFRTRQLDGTPFISALYFYRVAQGDALLTAVLVRELSPPVRVDPAKADESEWCLE